MSNKCKIVEYIRRFVSLNDQDADFFSAAFKKLRVKKKQSIVQPNFIAKSRYYILNGAFRAFVLDDLGKEHTLQLSIEDWWISDYNSYIYQQPATMFVVALEDSLVLQLDFEKEQLLKAGNHKFETFFRIIAERSTAYMQRRIITNLTKSAEDRYHEFADKYPLIMHRVPQYALASYLDFSPEFLSRLRRKIAKKVDVGQSNFLK